MTIAGADRGGMIAAAKSQAGIKLGGVTETRAIKCINRELGSAMEKRS